MDFPPVYSAIYSGVPVYEAMVQEIPIMRRMADNYLNATQILKVAGFSKPKRTKILEQEVLQGMHEKIQGGYGKYQGTWIPLEAGRALANRYNVEGVLSDILDFNPAEDPVGTKPVGKRVSRPREDDFSRTPQRSRVPSTITPLGSPSNTGGIARQEPTPIYRETIRERQFTLPTTLVKRPFDETNAQRDFFESVYARKRTRTAESMTENSSEEMAVPEIYKSITKTPNFKQSLLMHIFVCEDSAYNTAVFEEMIKGLDESINDLEIELDGKRGTLMHWAAAYARIRLIDLLISKGMKIRNQTKQGLTPLMEAVQSSRNFSNQTMSALLALLGPSLFALDNENRNALHYVNELSKFRSKRQISTYYMEEIAKYIEDTRMTLNSPHVAFIDVQDSEKNTALHLACHYRNHKNAALLIRLGATKTIENGKKETPMSLSAHDYRLLDMMQNESFGPTIDSDQYDDAPTTPMSDVTDISASQSSIYHSNATTMDGIESVTLHVAKHELSELHYYKHRFELIQNYAAKIKSKLDQSGNVAQFPVNTVEPNQFGGFARDRGSSQIQMMTETKLSSQLIRLEALIKVSLDDQFELVSQLESFQTKRLTKDERYNSMLASVCKVKDISKLFDYLSDQ